MAKKRVNTKLLTILVVGFSAVLAVGAIAFALGFGRETPAELVARAQEAEAEGEVARAMGLYSQAARRSGSDVELLMKTASLAPAATVEDEKWFAIGQSAVQLALEADPGYEPALRANLDAATEAIDAGYVSESYAEALGERADALLAAAPDDPQARLAKGRAMMLRAVLNPDASDPEQERQAAELLAEASASDDPAAHDRGKAATYFAQLKARIAARQRNLDIEAARATYAEAQALVDDVAARYPDDAGVLTSVHRARLILAQTAAYVGLGTDAAAEQLRLANESLDAALAALPEGDPDATEVRLVAGRHLAGIGRRDEALATLRAGLAADPSAMALRDALAETLIDAGRPGEALAVLGEPAPEPAEWVGREAINRRLAGVDEQGLVVEALVKQAALEAEGSDARQETLAQARRELEKYEGQVDRTPEYGTTSARHPNTNRLRGLLAVVEGRESAAIAALENARTAMGDRGRTSRERKTILLNLFYANRDLNQTLPARQALQELLQVSPGADRLRFEMAKLLEKENDFEGALAELDRALEMDPDNPQYAAARVAVAARTGGGGGAGGAADGGADYDALPEATLAEAVTKRSAAERLGRRDEVLRLSEVLYEMEPDRQGIAVDYANVLRAAGRTDEAIAVLQQRLAEAPDDELAARRLDRLTSSDEDFLERNLTDYQKLLVEYQQKLALEEEEAALDALQRALEIQPEDDSTATRLYVNALLADGRFDDAEQVVDAFEADGDPLMAKLFRVALLVARGDSDRAAVVAAELRESMPYDYRTKLAYAKVLQSRGRYGEAEREYQGVLDLQPFNTDALEGLIVTKLTQGLPDEAEVWIREARRLQPDNARFREREINWELRYGDPAKVVESRRRLVEQNPDSSAAKLALAIAHRAVGARAARRGDEATLQARLREVVAALTPVVENDPDYRQMARVAGLLADAHRQLGDPAAGERAIERATQGAALAGTDLAALLRANYLASAGEPGRAVEAIQARLPEAQNEVALRRRLSELLLAAGRPDEAVAALGGDNPALQQLRVETLVNLGRVEQATAEVEAALDEKPGDPALVALATFADLRAGRFDAAGQRLAALPSDADDPRLRLVRGIYRVAKPDPDLDGAAEDFRAVSAANPRNLDARRRLADVYARQGRDDQAIAALREVVDAEPLNVPSRVALAQLFQRVDPPRLQSAGDVLEEGLELPGLADDPTLLTQRGLLAARSGRGSEAERYLERAYRASGGSPQAAALYFDQMLRGGSVDTLRREIDARLAQTPDAPWLHAYRGRALARTGDQAGATRSYARAAELTVAAGGAGNIAVLLNETSQQVGPEAAVQVYESAVAPAAGDDPAIKTAAAQTYQAAGDHDAAARLAGEARAAAPADTPLHGVASRVYAGALLEQTPRRPAEAAAVLEELLAGSPDDVAVLNNLAYALTLTGSDADVDRAVELSTRAVDRLGGLGEAAVRQISPFVLDTHGWARVLDGDVEEGLGYIVDAVGRRPFPQGMLHRAEAELKLGRDDAARSSAALGLELVAAEQAEGRPVRDEIVSRLEEIAG